MSTLERPHPKGLLHNLAFSQVVVASGMRTIYTAGQVSVDEHGALVGADDLAEQTAQSMRNIGLALAAAGASYADIRPSSRAGCRRRAPSSVSRTDSGPRL